ncbi:uncharacterized protein K441DRAFT_699906 [Cenococcum geophilum 1.58]|uniref:uncharacterized protein n=1 Tax=Cenococcum geophilum 1.58 TaxID=794803 RepID=UPI00358FA9FE|nr:hypothetical protein K441DRAFT_699906 [Cenococcum geophilum 1.58]
MLAEPTITAIRAVWAAVHSPSGLSFPAAVSALSALNVNRYRIDYITSTATVYIGTEADVAPIPSHSSLAGTLPWDSTKLVAAIRNAQAGVGNYEDFAKAAIEAGVTDYTVYLEGKRVVYCGGLGDCHMEWFPGAKKN